MPSLSEHQSATTTKILAIGDSGSGKTGALASLVFAGYKLRIIDMDNGLDILATKIKEKDPKLLASVDFETCTDKFSILGGKPAAASAEAWTKALSACTKFTSAPAGPKDILVLDTMTFAGEAALRYILKLNARPQGPPQLQDWGAAMTLTENLIAMLTSAEVKMNVIVNAHVKYIGNEDVATEPVRGYPAVIGAQLSPKIGRYFNSLLLFRTVAGGKRELHTNSFPSIELKNPNPAKVAKTYPIETGLADYFKAVRGE